MEQKLALGAGIIGGTALISLIIIKMIKNNKSMNDEVQFVVTTWNSNHFFIGVCFIRWLTKAYSLKQFDIYSHIFNIVVNLFEIDQDNLLIAYSYISDGRAGPRSSILPHNL